MVSAAEKKDIRRTVAQFDRLTSIKWLAMSLAALFVVYEIISSITDVRDIRSIVVILALIVITFTAVSLRNREIDNFNRKYFEPERHSSHY